MRMTFNTNPDGTGSIEVRSSSDAALLGRFDNANDFGRWFGNLVKGRGVVEVNVFTVDDDASRMAALGSEDR